MFDFNSYTIPYLFKYKKKMRPSCFINLHIFFMRFIKLSRNSYKTSHIHFVFLIFNLLSSWKRKIFTIIHYFPIMGKFSCRVYPRDFYPNPIRHKKKRSKTFNSHSFMLFKSLYLQNFSLSFAVCKKLCSYGTYYRMAIAKLS